MSERRTCFEDKEKMYKSSVDMKSDFAFKILSLFKTGEEITSKELYEKSKEINQGYSFKMNAINGILCTELKDRVKSCGKNKWRLVK